jgi:hypothetical protein
MQREEWGQAAATGSAADVTRHLSMYVANVVVVAVAVVVVVIILKLLLNG